MTERDPKRDPERPNSRGAATEFERYPDNNLCEPVRSIEDVPSLHEVIISHFLKKIA